MERSQERKSSSSVKVFYPRLNKEEIILLLSLEPHVYTEEEYEEMKDILDKMTKDRILLFSH